ncbi:hypothetical protein [Nonomuraea sp. CA-141351]|uniref:hypothetical protein n=1 Tax=Nonomuraea sp. CA-141351 TaxID=3239996 RepID=UPI003D8CB4C5
MALVFFKGAQRLSARYEDLGLSHLLPTDRVWVGVRSSEPGTLGGFHHPRQGYRHQQMGAIVTRYGSLAVSPSSASELSALDLFRSYAHDCLHYGSFRQYSLRDGEVVRTRYGFNLRDADGHTYSAPDPSGSKSTRNLGIVMEGATDREATALTRWVADSLGYVEPASGIDRFAFLDVTGRLHGGHLDELSTHGNAYLSAMASYARSVNLRYDTFLAEIGRDEAADLHKTIVQAMISGHVHHLTAWLDERHGPGTFRSLFRAASYKGPEPGG